MTVNRNNGFNIKRQGDNATNKALYNLTHLGILMVVAPALIAPTPGSINYRYGAPGLARKFTSSV